MSHHVKVAPIKIKREHPVVDVDAIHVVGYRAVCSCGDRSPVKKSHVMASLWKHDHIRARS